MSERVEVSEDEEISILRLYMKSGNVICLPHVTDVEYKSSSSSRSLTYTRVSEAGGERLIINSLDLSQIEAITVENSPDAE